MTAGGDNSLAHPIGHVIQAVWGPGAPGRRMRAYEYKERSSAVVYGIEATAGRTWKAHLVRPRSRPLSMLDLYSIAAIVT